MPGPFAIRSAFDDIVVPRHAFDERIGTTSIEQQDADFLCSRDLAEEEIEREGLIDEIVFSLQFRIGRNQEILMINLHAMARIEDKRRICVLRAIAKGAQGLRQRAIVQSHRLHRPEN